MIKIEDLSFSDIKIIKGIYKGKEGNATKLSRKVNITYSHLRKRCQKLKEIGIIEEERNKRIVNIKLSVKGKKIGRKLYEIDKILDGDE